MIDELVAKPFLELHATLEQPRGDLADIPLHRGKVRDRPRNQMRLSAALSSLKRGARGREALTDLGVP